MQEPSPQPPHPSNHRARSRQPIPQNPSQQSHFCRNAETQSKSSNPDSKTRASPAAISSPSRNRQNQPTCIQPTSAHSHTASRLQRGPTSPTSFPAGVQYTTRVVRGSSKPTSASFGKLHAEMRSVLPYIVVLANSIELYREGLASYVPTLCPVNSAQIPGTILDNKVLYTFSNAS